MTNDSYIIEYQVKEDCNSRYTFGDIMHYSKNFSEVTLSEIKEFGFKEFGEDFTIDFNNEIVYELYDEDSNSSIETFANFNLLKPSDVKDGERLLKVRTFHSLNTNSDLFKKLSNKNMTELKIPANDILILRKGNTELYLEFDYDEIFKEVK
jgi:hypothetical protein